MHRLEKLIDTLDKTVASLKGDGTMSDKDVFEGFNESRYEDEARERWGDDPKYAESQAKWSSYSKERKEAIKAEGGPHRSARVSVSRFVPVASDRYWLKFLTGNLRSRGRLIFE